MEMITMKLSRIPAAALILAALALTSCKQDSVAEKYHPAKLDSTEVKGIMKVTLDSKAAERIGLQTTEITEEGSRKVIPYGALMYDLKGKTWTFTSPTPLVFVRAEVKVDEITGDKVYLSEGPATGTKVVTVGAPMLMGAEHKYGH
jgi:ABC-type oligopeptide transport system substrate-binding subunit